MRYTFSSKVSLLVALLLLTGGESRGQSYRTHQDEARGVEWKVPPSFEEIPVPPTEKVILAHYERKRTRKQARKGKVVMGRPTLRVIALGLVQPPEAEGEEGQKKRTTAQKPIAELAPQRAQAFFKRYVRRAFVLERKRLRAASGLPLRVVYELYPSDPSKEKNPRKRPGPVGIARLYCDPEGIFLVLGLCDDEDFREHRAMFEKMAASLRRFEPVDTEAQLAEAAEEYRSKGYKQPEYRAKVDADLPEGWKAIHTENYVIVQNSRDKSLVNAIARDIEGVRRKYEELFPPVGPIDAVSTVRVCRDRTTYLAYYGNPRSAGFWNSNTKELVLYGARKGDQGSRLGKLDTFIVLYHEAFHQYIFYAVGEIAPHIWFNEGFADYFSGSRFRGGKVTDIHINPWRVNRIRSMVADSEGPGADKYRSVEKLIGMSKAEYYKNGPQNYAQGWSFIYFLNDERVLKKHPEWQGILPTYFEVLKSEYAQGLAALGEEGAKDPRQKGAAMAAARKKANEMAFEGFDDRKFDELEEAWVTFVKKLPEFKVR